jgi:arginine exporter protein ArgO
MRQRYSYGFLLQAATRASKYFLLGLASGTIIYFLSIGLGLTAMSDLLVTLLETVLLRLVAVIVSLLAIAIILESLRH